MYITSFTSLRSRAAALFELPAGTSSHRLLPMEGMRGLSAALVFFVHFTALFGSRAGPTTKPLFSFIAAFGTCGVDVFFALSGFIIYGMLLRKPYRYFGFVQRRIVRLYPVFTVIFVIYVTISLAVPSLSKIPGVFPWWAVYLGANFLLLPGIFPIVPMITVAWSLSYELCFYLTLPLPVRALRLFAWPRWARVLWWSVVCLAAFLLDFSGHLPHSRLLMFACGILLRDTIHWRVPAERFGQWVALAAFAGALFLVGLKDSPGLTAYRGTILTTPALVLAALFGATYALGYFALANTGFVARWFSWDWLRWFGNMSYSYYLTHGLVLHVLRRALVGIHLPARLSPVSFLALTVFAFAGTVAGSAVVFLAVEKPFSFTARSASASSRTPV